MKELSPLILAEAWWGGQVSERCRLGSLVRTFRSQTLLVARSEGSAALPIVASMSMNYKTEDKHQAALALKRCQEDSRGGDPSSSEPPST